jgi:hypothetical protein
LLLGSLSEDVVLAKKYSIILPKILLGGYEYGVSLSHGYLLAAILPPKTLLGC